MATITMNNQDYDSELTSDKAKAQLTSIQFVDMEHQRLNAQTAVLRTAHANALQAALPPLPMGDIIKLN